MALVSRVKSPEWAAGDTLTHTDLIAEFNNLVNALNGSNDANVINFAAAGTLECAGNATIGSNNSNSHIVKGSLNVYSNLAVVNNITGANGTIGNVNATTGLIAANVNVVAALPPIGSIIPHYDFNANLTAQINTTYWAYCNGQSKTINGVSETLPDLSGRYLVGFGSDDTANSMVSASWTTDELGNSLHASPSLAHTHTGPSHTHTSAAHTHGAGTFYAEIGATSTNRITYVNSGDTFTGTDRMATGGIGMDATNEASTDAVAIAGTSASTTPGVTGAGGTGATGSALTTVSVQPRSVRVRYVMRIK